MGGGVDDDDDGGVGGTSRRRNGAGNKSVDCNTSMELHSSVSLQERRRSARMSCWAPEQEGGGGATKTKEEEEEEDKTKQVAEADGNESTGSPRSFDSHSSIGKLGNAAFEGVCTCHDSLSAHQTTRFPAPSASVPSPRS